MTRIPPQLLFLLISILAIPAYAQAQASTPQNVVDWTPSDGIPPAPYARLTYDDKFVYAYSWGGDPMTRDDHWRVGLFRTAITPHLSTLLDHARSELLAHRTECKALPPSTEPHSRSPSFGFRFITAPGKAIVCNTRYGGLSHEFRAAVQTMRKVYSEVADHGSPIAALIPSLRAERKDKALLIQLSLSNPGTESISLTGPEQWSDAWGPLPHAKVSAYHKSQIAFTVHLTANYLTETSPHSRQITLLAGETKTFTFKLPEAELKPATPTAQSLVFADLDLHLAMTVALTGPNQPDGTVYLTLAPDSAAQVPAAAP